MQGWQESAMTLTLACKLTHCLSAATVGQAEVRLRWAKFAPKALSVSIHNIDVEATTRQVPQVRSLAFAAQSCRLLASKALR